MHKSYEGIFAALSTPFIGDRIAPEKFEENIQKYNSFDLAGYVVLGTTGESVFLSDEESEKLVLAAKEAASPEKKIIVGTGRESTHATLEFTDRMARLGIDAALVRTPSYYRSRMDDEALKKHYLTIAERSKVPVLLYNIPQLTNITISAKLIIELSHHSNIKGIKDSSGNLAFLGEVVPHLAPGFSFILGAGSVFLQGLLMGACGGILRLAVVAPAQCAELYRLYSEKKFDEAQKLQLDLIPLNKAIIQTHGIPGLKYALDLLGYYGGPPRSPLLPLDEKGKKETEAILKNLGSLTTSIPQEMSDEKK
jgi:4-hydroxy-2-oxoglutarate aldolase